MKKIILIGAGGHAKTVVDTIEQQGIYEIAGFVDKNDIEREIYRSYKVLGNDDDLETLFRKGIHFAMVTMGYMGKTSVRNKLYSKLKQIGFSLPVIVDSTAVVSGNVVLGEGSYIGRTAVINADVEVGKMCIINSAAVIEHECIIGDFTHVAVGTVVCGQSEIGKNVLLGARSVVIQQKKVSDFSIIGAGAIVTKNIPENSTAVGIPARIIKIMGS